MATQPEPIAVIGAGLSGLAAAVRLAKQGHRVIVLEANAGIGGCCSTAEVDGFRFNNGAIYMAAPALLRHAFSRLGMDFDARVHLLPVAVPQLSVMDNGTRIFTTTVGNSWVEGDNAGPRTARYRMELDRLYQTWRPIYRRLMDGVLPHEMSTLRVLSQLWRYLPKMTGTLGDLVRKSFSDADVRAAVGAVVLYTGMAPQDMPATQIIGLMTLLDEGFFLPEGGMGRIPAALGEEAALNGVEFRLGAVVDRIVFHGGALQGVRLAGGEFVPARAVVATPSALALVECLLEPGTVPARLRRRARRAPLSHRAISIQLGVQWKADAAAEAFAVNHVPPLEEQSRMHLPAEGAVRWFSYTSPDHVTPRAAPDGMAVVETFAPVPPGLRADQIGAGQVEDIVARHIAALQRHRPCRIVARRVLAPVDFASQRHLYEGALYGLSPGARPSDYFPRRSGMAGLYLAGQTTYPGYGVAPVMLSGIHAADAILSDRG